MYDVDRIRQDLPEECEISLDHAEIHLAAARDSMCEEDMMQEIHEFRIAGMILLVLASDIEDNAGTPEETAS